MEPEETEEKVDAEVQEDAPVAPTLSYSILGTKGLSAVAKHISWSSTMDVVAIVSEENTISLHRLNWQRIWSVTETREVTCLSWKYDGKSLVTGFEEGHYTIWDIENGAVRYSTVKHGTSTHLSRPPITTIGWFNQGHAISTLGGMGGRRYADTGRTKLATLWALQGVDAPLGGLFSSSTMESDQSSLTKQSSIGESSTTRLEQSEPSSLNVLVVGHTEGVIYLYGLGTFQIAKIDLPSLLHSSYPSLQFGSVGIITTHLSSDLSELSVVVQLRSKDDSLRFDEQGGEVGPDGTTMLLKIDVSLIRKRLTELLAVIWQCTLIQDLYYRIAALTEKMAMLWSDAITPFLTKMKNFHERLETDHQTVEGALLALLATGTQSPMLETLLAVNLGPKNAETIMKAIDTTCESLELLVTQHLRPTVERLMFRLVLLNSYARYKMVFSDIGLSQSFINAMMETTQNMISHSANFVLHLGRAQQFYGNFLRWIHRFTLEEPDPEATHTYNAHLVGQFLRRGIRDDFIGELIRGRLLPPSTALPGPVLASTSMPPPAKPQAAPTRSPPRTGGLLDDSLGLGTDDSLHYSEMSMDLEETNLLPPTTSGSPSTTPLKSLFKLPMTSSPEASNMGPISFIDLPPAFSIGSESSNSNLLRRATSSQTQGQDKMPSFWFSGLRASVHQNAEQLFESISNAMSKQISVSSVLKLFTRPELLGADSVEVFPMKNFVSVLMAEHSFQFVAETDEVLLLFRDGNSMWTLQTTSEDSFGASGIEISSLHYEGEQSWDEDTLLDIKYYKDQHVLALIKPAGDTSQECQIQRLSIASLQYYPTKMEVSDASNGVINYFDEIVMMHPFQHTSEECLQSQRNFSADPLCLAVSGGRGVGLLSCAPRKCIVLDFESDETPE